MGSTPYYQCNVSATSLTGIAVTAGELEDWKSWSVFERFQRELDISRVRREIVPYLARTKDRFFSALIVLVYQPEVFEFTPASEYLRDIPGAFAEAASELGFLTIEGGKLVVLDGQHRLTSLRAVLARDHSVEGEFVKEIASDELAVIFIQHESFEKTRRIFNKVNRYARPTSISDNVITSEDDGCAIVARWLVEPEPPLEIDEPLPPLRKTDSRGEPMVEWRSNKLEAGSTKITTLNHLYQSVNIILEANGVKGFDERHMVNRPSDKVLLDAYKLCAEWWSAVLEGMSALRAGFRNPASIPERRSYQHEDSLLFRPIGQIVLFRGLAGSVRLGNSLEESIERANQISWQTAGDHWSDIVVRANGRLMTKESDLRLASRYVTYLIAANQMPSNVIERLQYDLRTALDEPGFLLPNPV